MAEKIRKQSTRFQFVDRIFDVFRRDNVPPTDTIGGTGTAVYGGYIQVREKDPKLVGREKYLTFSDILVTCSIVGASVRFFINLVGKAEWKFEPADDSPQAQEFADMVKAMFNDMTTPWRRVVKRAAMYRFHGFSVQEWTAKRNEDGTIGLLDVEPRPQITIERWDMDKSGTVFGVIQRIPQDQEEVYIPRNKILYIVDDSLNDSPEGLGLFRHIVDPARRIKRLEQLEGYAYETDLRGIPVGRAPIAELDKMVANNQLSQTQRDAYLKGMTDFLSKHIKNPELGILLDSRTYTTTDESATPSQARQWDIDLMSGGATSQEAVARAIERLNREVARVFGTESLLLGSTGTGSLALSQDKSHNFALIVDDTLGEIAESVQADLVKTIFELNGWPKEMMPKAKTESVNIRDVTQIGQVLRDIATAAGPLPPDAEAIGEVFDLLGLTRPDMGTLQDMMDSMVPNPQPGAGPGVTTEEPATGVAEPNEE